MFLSLAGPTGAQLADAARAGACTLLGLLPRLMAPSRQQLAAAPHERAAPGDRRRFAALAATGYPSPDAPTFHYAVLEAPLMLEHSVPVPGAIPRHLLPFAQRMASLGGRRAAGKPHDKVCGCLCAAVKAVKTGPHVTSSAYLYGFCQRLQETSPMCCPAPAGQEAVYEAAVSAAQAGQPFAIVLGTGGTEAAALKLCSHYHKEYLKAQQARSWGAARYGRQAAGRVGSPALFLVGSNSPLYRFTSLHRWNSCTLDRRPPGSCHTSRWAGYPRQLCPRWCWWRTHSPTPYPRPWRRWRRCSRRACGAGQCTWPLQQPAARRERRGGRLCAARCRWAGSLRAGMRGSRWRARSRFQALVGSAGGPSPRVGQQPADALACGP